MLSGHVKWAKFPSGWVQQKLHVNLLGPFHTFCPRPSLASQEQVVVAFVEGLWNRSSVSTGVRDWDGETDL